MKQEKVRVSPKGMMTRAANKWRSDAPKFAAKPEKSTNLVQAGGMEVDAARAEEYENWRKDKIEEANERRVQSQRRFKAAREARLNRTNTQP